jgi:hypothetical protein
LDGKIKVNEIARRGLQNLIHLLLGSSPHFSDRHPHQKTILGGLDSIQLTDPIHKLLLPEPLPLGGAEDTAVKTTPRVVAASYAVEWSRLVSATGIDIRLTAAERGVRKESLSEDGLGHPKVAAVGGLGTAVHSRGGQDLGSGHIVGVPHLLCVILVLDIVTDGHRGRPSLPLGHLP